MKRLLLLVALAVGAASTATAQDTSPPDDGAVTTQPVPVGRLAEPVYPRAARRARVSSQVILKLCIRTDGGVEAAEVVSQTESRGTDLLPTDNPYAPLFAAAAIEAARQWSFTPAVLRGAAVEVWVTVPIRFRNNR